jgi:hypothetical protein
LSVHSISEAFPGEGDRKSGGIFRRSVGVILEEAVQPRMHTDAHGYEGVVQEAAFTLEVRAVVLKNPCLSVSILG